MQSYYNNPYMNNSYGYLPNQANTINNYQPPYQQMQPTGYTQPSNLVARVVNSIESVSPAEIPMNGTPSLFITNDGSKIYAKTWATDGTITTTEYVPAVQEAKEEANPYNDIWDRLNGFEKRFDQLDRKIEKRYRQQGGNKNENE